MVVELLGYAKGLDINIFLPSVAVLITHCDNYVSKSKKKISKHKLQALIKKL